MWRVTAGGQHSSRPLQFARHVQRHKDSKSFPASTGQDSCRRAVKIVDTDHPPDASELEALNPGGKWGDLLPSIPEGENYLWHTDRSGGTPLFGWRTRYWSFLLKLSKRLPSWTVQAQPGSAIGPFHWDSRRLTFSELCRLQTFPDNLTVDCGRTEMQRMLGNAVPSLIAEVLAREIRRQLLDAPIRKQLKLLPPLRENVPAPVKVAPVPRKYHEHIGVHDAHPGTGKGREALKRAAQNEAAASQLVT